MSGPTTLSRIARTTAGNSACSSHEDALPSGLRESRRRSISLTCFPTCSFYSASRGVFGPTTDRSSSPRLCGNGSRRWLPGPPASCRAVYGKRLLRELQIEALRRTAQWRNHLNAQGVKDHYRKLTTSLQHRSAAAIAGLRAAGTRNYHVAPPERTGLNTRGGQKAKQAEHYNRITSWDRAEARCAPFVPLK